MFQFSVFDVASEIICIHRRCIGITLFLLVGGCCVVYFVLSLFATIHVPAVGVSIQTKIYNNDNPRPVNQILQQNIRLYDTYDKDKNWDPISIIC